MTEIRCQEGKDHEGAYMVSTTYPIRRLEAGQAVEPGTDEALLNYPCFPVYIKRTHEALNTDHGKSEVGAFIWALMSALRQHQFFRAFKGIRFEFHGLPRESIVSTSTSKTGDKKHVARSLVYGVVAEHYVKEREHRHMLCVFRSIVQKIIQDNLNATTLRAFVSQNGPVSTYDNFQRILLANPEIVQTLCSIGGTLSPDFNTVDRWRRRVSRAHTTFSPCGRMQVFSGGGGGGSSSSSFASSSTSISNMTRITPEDISAQELTRLTIGLMYQFHAPLTPNSFEAITQASLSSSSSSSSSWHSVALIVSDLSDPERGELEMMSFQRTHSEEEISAGTMRHPASFLSFASHLPYRIQRLTLSSNDASDVGDGTAAEGGSRSQRRIHVAYALGNILKNLGLARADLDELVKRVGSRAGVSF